MPSSATDALPCWGLVKGLAVGIVVLAVVALVPPGTLPFPPGSPYSDAALAHWPNAFFLRQSVWQFGAWPLWNPLRMLGQPFAANPLSKVWYPPQWLVLIFPPTLHLNLLLYLHAAWLTLGMMAWARADGLHPLAAGFAALAWGLNAKLMAHLGAGHLDIVYALAWAPWLLWAVRRVVDEQAAGPAVRLGGIAALLALADLRVAFYLLPVGLAYGGMWAVRARGAAARGWSRLLPAGMAAGAVFLLLTAVQTIPLAALSPHLTRSAITPLEAAIYSLPPAYLLGTVIPDPGGFHEWMTYLGLPVIVLAVVAGFRPGRRAEIVFWWLLALVAALWALGDHGPLFGLAAHLPLIGWFRVPSRAWLVVALSVTAIATIGLDRLVAEELGWRVRVGALGLVVAGVVWWIAGLLVVPHPSPQVGSLGYLLLGVGASLWLASAQLPAPLGSVGSRWAGLGLLLGVLVVSQLLVARTLVEGRRLNVTDQVDEALIARLGGFCDRVYSPSFDLIGPAAAQAGIPTLHGVDPFQLQWSAAAIAEAAGVRPEGYSVTAPPLPSDSTADLSLMLKEAPPDAQQLAALGVYWVISHFPIEDDGLVLHSRLDLPNGDEAYLYETQGGVRAFIAPEEVNQPLQSDARRVHMACLRSPNGLIEATFDSLPVSDPAVLVLDQAWAPGWRAWVDGQPVPVLRVGGVLVGVEVPTLGVHTLKVAYRPVADYVGIAVTATTGMGLVVWGIAAHRGRKRDDSRRE